MARICKVNYWRREGCTRYVWRIPLKYLASYWSPPAYKGNNQIWGKEWPKKNNGIVPLSSERIITVCVTTRQSRKSWNSWNIRNGHQDSIMLLKIHALLWFLSGIFRTFICNIIFDMLSILFLFSLFFMSLFPFPWLSVT